jgi:hypothetical protein
MLAGETPVSAGMGFAIVRFATALVPPPGGGFVTAIASVPAFCSSDNGTVMVIEVGEVYAVASGVVPLVAVVFLANPVPVNVTVAAVVLPSGICAGVIRVNAGNALEMENTPGPAAAPPPGAGFVTPTVTFPDPCKKFALTCPVSEVDETNVVGMGVPANVTVDAGPKFVPETVIAMAEAPAVARFGA